MNNEEKAEEFGKKVLESKFKNGCFSGETVSRFCEISALKMADWKDKQTAEALHKACLAIMEDLGSKLGKIQLKAAAVLNNIPDEYVLDKMGEIIDAASDINKFAETFESYLRSQLGLKTDESN